jgi:hypothetical protein
MNTRLPLNEPQERRVSIILAHLESALRELRSSLLDPPQTSLLTRYEDPVDPALAEPLERRIARAEAQVARMARDLDLPKSRTSILRGHLARFQLLIIDLYGTLPSSGLRGYGEVAPATAQYLEREIPKLETLAIEIIRLLERGK